MKEFDQFEFFAKWKTSAEVQSALSFFLDSFRLRSEANNGEDPQGEMKGDYACSMLNMSEDFSSGPGRIIWVSKENERILH